jgi:hypothetical protein
MSNFDDERNDGLWIEEVKDDAVSMIRGRRRESTVSESQFTKLQLRLQQSAFFGILQQRTYASPKNKKRAINFHDAMEWMVDAIYLCRRA